MMAEAFAVVSIQLPSEPGQVIETDSFRVLEVYLCRATAERAANRLNEDHSETEFCYVVQSTSVVDLKEAMHLTEPVHVTYGEPEYRLILSAPGDRRRNVALLIRQVMGVSLVAHENLVIATGSHFEVQQIHGRFAALGATTIIEVVQ